MTEALRDEPLFWRAGETNWDQYLVAISRVWKWLKSQEETVEEEWRAAKQEEQAARAVWEYALKKKGFEKSTAEAIYARWGKSDEEEQDCPDSFTL